MGEGIYGVRLSKIIRVMGVRSLDGGYWVRFEYAAKWGIKIFQYGYDCWELLRMAEFWVGKAIDYICIFG